MTLPKMQPEHDAHLEKLLASAVEHVKALHITLSAVMVDVAALRQSMLDDPEDIRRYSERLKEGIHAAKPLVEEAKRSYDELIRRIRSLEEWKQ